MDIHGYPWITMDIHGGPWYPWISMDIHGYPWISMDIHGCHGHPWISTDIHGYPWIFMDIHGYPWTWYPWTRDIHGYPWMPMDIHEYPSTSMDIHGYPWISKPCSLRTRKVASSPIEPESGWSGVRGGNIYVFLLFNNNTETQKNSFYISMFEDPSCTKCSK